MATQRVVVAMSGGVDSSMTAALLRKQGYEVCGITMRLQPGLQSGAIEVAREVARELNIPHQVVDFNSTFTRRVVAPFCREYSHGRTPNPCVNCNRYIKFGALLDIALGMGVDYMATGHYARIEASSTGYRLLKGMDAGKDQSYFLYTLSQQQLKHIMFPLGKLHKIEVKRMATELGLYRLIRSESQDICFVPDGDYSSYIAKNVAPQPGDIVDVKGRILGRHKGLMYYTVGQRQGLGLTGRERLYVIRLDAESNRLVIGSKACLYACRLQANNLDWVVGHPPSDISRLTAKVRYKSPETAGSLRLEDDTADFCFEQPQWAITPGQSVVFYRGDEVLGGGIIQDSELELDHETAKENSETILC